MGVKHPPEGEGGEKKPARGTRLKASRTLVEKMILKKTEILEKIRDPPESGQRPP